MVKLLLDELQEFIDTGAYMNGRQLYDAYDYSKTHPEAAPSATFGEFLESVMAKLKTEGRSSNIEQYATLCHALTGVNKKIVNRPKHFTPAMYNGIRIFDIPLRAISNRHFIAFGEWIKETKNGAGYRNLMTTFKAVISRAHQQELTNNVLTYKFKAYMPVKTLSGKTAKEKIRAKGQSVTILTEDEFAAFEQFDILRIAPPQQRFRELLQIYKDLVLLLYYTRSRPADVISLRHGKEYDEESHTIVYTPRKLASRINSKGRPCCVTLRLPGPAIDIINRYKGRSRGGNPLKAKIIIIAPAQVFQPEMHIDANSLFQGRADAAQGLKQFLKAQYQLWAKHMFHADESKRSGVYYDDYYNSPGFRHWVNELSELAEAEGINPDVLSANVAVVNEFPYLLAEPGTLPDDFLLPSQHVLRQMMMVRIRSSYYPHPLFILPRATRKRYPYWARVMDCIWDGTWGAMANKVTGRMSNRDMTLSPKGLGSDTHARVLETIRGL